MAQRGGPGRRGAGFRRGAPGGGRGAAPPAAPPRRDSLRASGNSSGTGSQRNSYNNPPSQQQKRLSTVNQRVAEIRRSGHEQQPQQHGLAPGRAHGSRISQSPEAQSGQVWPVPDTTAMARQSMTRQSASRGAGVGGSSATINLDDVRGPIVLRVYDSKEDETYKTLGVSETASVREVCYYYVKKMRLDTKQRQFALIENVDGLERFMSATEQPGSIALRWRQQGWDHTRARFYFRLADRKEDDEPQQQAAAAAAAAAATVPTVTAAPAPAATRTPSSPAPLPRLPAAARRQQHAPSNTFGAFGASGDGLPMPAARRAPQPAFSTAPLPNSGTKNAALARLDSFLQESEDYARIPVKIEQPQLAPPEQDAGGEYYALPAHAQHVSETEFTDLPTFSTQGSTSTATSDFDTDAAWGEFDTIMQDITAQTQEFEW